MGSNFELHRMLQDWGEGKKTGLQGALATAGEATWTARSAPATKWSKPGAAAPTDFQTQPSATISMGANGSYTFRSSSNLVADVQSWLDNSTTNFGWILISQGEAIPGTARRIASRENSNPQYVPKLSVQFSAGSASAGPRIDMAERVGDRFKLRFTSEIGRVYAVEFLDSLTTANATNWSVLMQVTAVTNNIIVLDPALSSRQRFYRIRTQ